VVSAARGIARAEHPAFVFPVVVLDGQLVSFDYAPDGSERLSFSEWERILWGGGPDLSVPTVVDIVTRPLIENYARRIWAELDRVRDEVPDGLDFDPPGTHRV
jgi:hypothetical protein